MLAGVAYVVEASQRATAAVIEHDARHQSVHGGTITAAQAALWIFAITLA
jgi:hypothetical protein